MADLAEERLCRVGEVTLCYQTFGERDRPAMLLVMGLGMQMLGWPEDFCAELAARGFYVIRFDNRDVGRSTRLHHVPPPSRSELLLRRPRHVAYTLRDMADDAAGLLEHLELGAAHVVGASMGGMIAQVLAAHRPERVRSLASIMSTTGGRLVGQPAMRLVPLFLARPATQRDAYVQAIVDVFKLIRSPGFPHDEQELRRMAAASYDRGISPAGTGRQLASILSAGNRTRDLRAIVAPTLVIHGTADRMVATSGGRATARAIPGARLMLIEGMGHDLPRGAWPQIVAALVDNASRAAAPAASTV